jgi:succinate dehydrogenase hydrophobic anchor subunit
MFLDFFTSAIILLVHALWHCYTLLILLFGTPAQLLRSLAETCSRLTKEKFVVSPYKQRILDVFF